MRFVRAGIVVCAASIVCCQKGPLVVRVEPAPAKPKPAVTHNFAIPVLMYHRVSPLSEQEAKSPLVRDLTVLPEDFEEQIRYLTENGYALLSVYDIQHALLNGEPLPKKAVAITLDDGYRDNFDNAFPILKKYGASATIFLVKNTVETANHLTWPQIREMRSSGVRYGSHTVSHADLPGLDDRGLDYELAESRQYFEAGLKEAVTSLAYPAGRFDERVVDHVRTVGYLTAWKKGGGPVRPSDDPFRLPRVRVHGRTTMRDFERKVTSGYWTMRMESGKSA